MRRLVLLLLLAGATGCWVPLERGRAMQARIDQLDQGQQDLQRRLDEEHAVVKDRVAKVDAKIAEVQKKIDELNHAARRSGADLAVNQTKLQDDLARLRGDLEVEQHRLGDLEKTLADLKDDTQGKLAALKGAGALDEFEARRKAQSLAKPDDRAAFLALAEKEEETGDKGVARELYQQYVRRWPSDPKAAEAGYRAGGLLAAQRRWREAILAFGKVAEDFPRSERAPAALLHVGEAMLQLEMKDDARAILQQVVDRYPKSQAADAAKDKLKDLAPAEREAKPEPKKRPPPTPKRKTAQQ
jgi:tol-pal system protein YbgF